MANAAPSDRPARLPGPPPPEQDWPAQTADTIERVVNTVRDRTTGPALTVARGVVYGTFAALVGSACLVVFVIALVRLIDAYLPDSVFGEDHMWAAHLILGLVFVIAGAVLWRRRHGGEDRQAAER
ncbi:MAG TPA: hypothetical protein VKZ72_12205 [Acidimicrobiales bacterium]|nr:hypothetical protein [Acidimicrobiales bacterium]